MEINMNDFWQALWARMMSFFTEAEQIALTFLQAAASSIAASGGALLVSAAEQAVIAAEAQGGSGSDKLNAAVDAVKGTLANAGMQAAENAIRIAIEAAVAKMKADAAKSKAE